MGKPGSDAWWAKVAKAAIRDYKLGATAFRLFCELALWCGRESGQVTRGQRALAADLHIHQETVSKALRELETRGHIQIESKGRERGRYVLLAAVYAPPPPKKMRKAA